MRKLLFISLLMLGGAVQAQKAPCCIPEPTDCGYNMAYRPDLKCEWGAFASASFIYYRAVEENLLLGLTKNNGSTEEAPHAGKILNVDWEYNPGFKVGLGLYTPCDDWQIYGEYTWYHSTVTDTNNASAEGVILVALTPGDSDMDETFSLKSKWKLDLDQLDINVSRKFFVGCNLVFEPLAGIRALWLDQNFDLSYIDSDDDPASITNSYDSWAVGVSAGFNTMWNICNGFRAFGKYRASLVYSDYDTKYQITSTNDSTEFHDIKQCNELLSSQQDFSAGLGWGRCFCCDKYYFDVEIGYDFSIYCNENQLVQFLDSHEEGRYHLISGDLFLHGLRISLRVDF